MQKFLPIKQKLKVLLWNAKFHNENIRQGMAPATLFWELYKAHFQKEPLKAFLAKLKKSLLKI